MKFFVKEEQVEEAVDYLQNNAGPAANAKANRIYMEDYSKVLKAELMSESNETSIGGQEKYAYAHPRMMEHIKAKRTAIYEDERHRFLLSAKHAIIDAYRTQAATERAMAL